MESLTHIRSLSGIFSDQGGVIRIPTALESGLPSSMTSNASHGGVPNGVEAMISMSLSRGDSDLIPNQYLCVTALPAPVPGGRYHVPARRVNMQR